MNGSESAWHKNPWVWGSCGCCAGCIAIPLVMIAVFGIGALTLIGQTDIYQRAVDRARAHPAAIAALGEPIETSWMGGSASINIEDDGGFAELKVPIEGPEGSGSLYARATKRGDEWIFDELWIDLDGGGEVDLLLGAPEDDRPAELPADPSGTL